MGLPVRCNAGRSDDPAPERQPAKGRRGDRASRRTEPEAARRARREQAERRGAVEERLSARHGGRADHRRSHTRMRRRREQLERECKIVRGVEAIVGPLLEAAADDARDGRRHARRQLRGVVLEDRGQRFRHRVALERPGTGQHLVHHDAEREDVRARVHRIGPHLFRRHVAGRAHDDARADIHRAGLGLHGAHELRDAEVQDFRAAVAREEQVLGLQVAMDDAAGVRGCQSARNLHGVVDRLSPAGWRRSADGHAGFHRRAIPRRCTERCPRGPRRRPPAGWDGRGRRRLSLPFRSAGRDRGR